MAFMLLLSFYICTLLLQVHCLVSTNIFPECQRRYLTRLNYLSLWKNESEYSLYVDSQQIVGMRSINESTSKFKILLIGDSLDLRIMRSIEEKKNLSTINFTKSTTPNDCYHLTHKVVELESQYLSNNKTYEIMNIFWCGTLLDSDCLLSRLNDTKQFRNSISFEPDLIVVKSFYWDIWRICSTSNGCANDNPMSYSPPCRAL